MLHLPNVTEFVRQQPLGAQLDWLADNDSAMQRVALEAPQERDHEEPWPGPGERRTRTRRYDETIAAKASGSLGTIDYASPEQIEGKPADARTDVYSLGCVLYESLRGHPPFQSVSPVAALFGHLSEQPPSLWEKQPELGIEIDEVIGCSREITAWTLDLRARTHEAINCLEHATLEREIRPGQLTSAPTTAPNSPHAASANTSTKRASHTAAAATATPNPRP